mgnify:CR=1 FL=1
MFRLSVVHELLWKYGQKGRLGFNHFLISGTEVRTANIRIWSVSVCLVEWLQNAQNISIWLPWLLASYYYLLFSNSIIKYGFILFFDADRYFTPLPQKPSMCTLEGGGVSERAPSDNFETLTVKLYILTLFEMIFWNCRDNFENKILTLFETTRVTSKTILKTMSLKALQACILTVFKTNWNCREHFIVSLVSLFSTTQKANDPCAQHIYIQEQCSTFDIDKGK